MNILTTTTPGTKALDYITENMKVVTSSIERTGADAT